MMLQVIGTICSYSRRAPFFVPAIKVFGTKWTVVGNIIKILSKYYDK